jgi:Protein of unknown function (DUF4238)
MDEPKRHHLVPRCYLKKFGKNKKKDWFVEAFDKTKDSNTIFEVNVKKICVQQEFYTLQSLPDDKKRFIEKFYATNIEANYTEIYDLLIDPYKTALSNKQRFEIIMFVVAQALRTSKLSTTFTKFWNETLAKGYSFMDIEKGIDKLHLEDGGIISFKDKTLKEVQKEQEQTNREYINIKNLEFLFDIGMRRQNDGIAVKRMHPDFKLISSDNPAYFDHNIFDPDGFVRLPLDEDYLLMLLPYKKDDQYYDPKQIVKSMDSEDEAFMDAHYNNLYQIQNSERYIIGKKENLEKALHFHNNLDEDVFVEKIKAISENAKNDLATLEKILK